MAINMETIEKMPTPQKAAIVGVVIVLIYVLFYFMWVDKNWKTIDLKTKEFDKLKSEVSRGKAVLQQIEEYRATQVKLENQLKDAEKKLPRQAEIPELLDKLSDLARGNMLVFTTFHPDQKGVGGGGMYQPIPIQVELSGEYFRLATFLDQVSKLERIINVEHLALVPSAKANLGASVKLVTYMFGG